jgi:hypothetical protein
MAGRCNWCSRQRAPSELLPLSTGQSMCRQCFEWHNHALAILSGAVPRGCQQCGTTMRDLNALATGATVRMYVVPIDGVYGVLCAVCKDTYCRKRADLYKDTQFGQRLKL